MFRLSQQGWNSLKKRKGLDTSFPEEPVKEQTFPIAWPDQIHPNEAMLSTQKLMHCPDAAAGFF